jgi:salicylate hydroxylase
MYIRIAIMLHLRSLVFSTLTVSVAAASTKEAADRELVVAIYGGGVASATLAQALKGHSHIDVQYFDPALDLTPTSFRLLGFDPKVHDALSLVNDEAGGVIDRAGWYPEEPSVVVIVCDIIFLRHQER